MYLSSVVNGTAVLIDQETISKALGLHPSLSSYPNINISSTYIFDREEYWKFISCFCNIQVPKNVFNNDKGFNPKHFIPIYQTLIEIVKYNIYPSLEKKVSFLVMKLIYQTVSNKINFNIPHMIMCKMVSSPKIGLNPYGLLLTKIFEYLKFNINIPPLFHVTYL